MSEVYTLADVQRMGASGAATPQLMTLDDVRKESALEAVRNGTATREQISSSPEAWREWISKRETTDLAHGVRRGLRDALDTGAELLATGWDKLTGSNEAARVKEMDDAARAEDMGGRPTTPGSMLGYAGGNALASTPLLRGGQMALDATGVPVLQMLGRSIASGGMSTGGPAPVGRVAQAMNAAIRTAGGGISGYVSGGLADPQTAGASAVVGAVTPPVVQGLGYGFGKARNVLSEVLRPRDARLAGGVMDVAGMDPRNVEQVNALQNALRQEGPQIIPGSMTVPEVMQNPGVSQLQRSVKAVQPAPLLARDAERETARRGVLERIAPIGNRGEVAREVGNAITDYALPAHEAARGRVSAAFEGVDPFGESRVLLPIEEMQAAQNKFLGPGTFGSGRNSQAAINEAQRIGTEVLPGVRPAAGGGRQPQDILQAVRRLGGISPNSAGGMNREIVELGRKQSGTTGLVSNKGKTIDRVAELMHERGFLSSPDPAELLDAIRGNLSGRPAYGADVVEDSFRARMERSMGDAPQAERIAKPVKFEELQNLRSSITEKWREAQRFGNAREAAALDAQRRAIDNALESLAAGKGQPGEYFAPDMVANYKDARQLHADKELRFKTGPQAGLFRQGGDGLPVAQGAEVPRRFFNGNASQVPDAQSFRRLVQDDPRLMDDLRRFAVSDAAAQTDRMGNLTNAKFNRWLNDRAGATGELFTEQQRAWLKAIADDLRRSDVAESLGRSSGSDTAQKGAAMLRSGLVENPLSSMAAGRVPFGREVLNKLSGMGRQAKANALAEMLADPNRLAQGLEYWSARSQQPSELNALARVMVPATLARTAPLLVTGQ